MHWPKWEIFGGGSTVRLDRSKNEHVCMLYNLLAQEGHYFYEKFRSLDEGKICNCCMLFAYLASVGQWPIEKFGLSLSPDESNIFVIVHGKPAAAE